MVYTVTDILEDIDFGCEERPADMPVLAVVELVDENGEHMRIKVPDLLLYERGIAAGSRVQIDEVTGEWSKV